MSNNELKTLDKPTINVKERNKPNAQRMAESILIIYREQGAFK